MKHLISSLLLSGLVAVGTMAQITYPANMSADTAHTPFLHGVASGDPLADAVMLWTRVTPDSAGSDVDVALQLATDATFSDIRFDTIVTTDSSADWTVRVDATGLDPGMAYAYRFIDGNGRLSRIGRTRTTPTGPTDRVRIAVASCSSIYGGFFNAYARIAERDLDAVVHLGDYIYEFVDENGAFRMPDPDPLSIGDNASVQDWRDRHAYYLFDPDLRAARAAHPWIMMWDNHDARTTDNGRQAFLEWNPIRAPRTTHDTIFRRFAFGDLVRLHVMDIRSFQRIDTLGDGSPSLITNDQRDWLLDGLAASPAHWNVVTSQEMFGDFSIGSFGPIVGIDDSVFDRGGWEGVDAERDTILNTIDRAGVSNPFFIAGDAHISMVMDLHPDPFDSTAYDGLTGAGSFATEFLPTSISRVNLDEMGLGDFAPAVENVAMTSNPHHVFSEFTEHGYGWIEFTPDQALARVWWSDILQITEDESLGFEGRVRSGDKHWDRAFSGVRHLDWGADRFIVSPNPTAGRAVIRSTRAIPACDVTVTDALGRLVRADIRCSDATTVIVDLHGLAPGLYDVVIRTDRGVRRVAVVKQ